MQVRLFCRWGKSTAIFETNPLVTFLLQTRHSASLAHSRGKEFVGERGGEGEGTLYCKLGGKMDGVVYAECESELPWDEGET